MSGLRRVVRIAAWGFGALLGLAPMLLVGDSLGGYSAMAAAEALPREPLRGLVLAGCTSPRETSRLFACFEASLARAAATVLIVNGDLDARAMAGEAVFAAAAASASVHHFQNTPHGVSMRRSAEFAGLVNRFAAQVLGTAPPR